jgi:hypothetical protein
MNVLESFIQGCSGAVVEHLAHNLKVGGSCPPCAQLLFRYTAGKFRWRIKLNRKFRSSWQKLFCSMYEMSQRHPVWVTGNHVKPCNSVRQKLGLVGRNRKKISQIIKDYFYFLFSLLIILWDAHSIPFHSIQYVP